MLDHFGIAEMHHLYLGDLHRHVEIDESWIEPAGGVTGGAELWQMPPGLANSQGRRGSTSSDQADRRGPLGGVVSAGA